MHSKRHWKLSGQLILSLSFFALLTVGCSYIFEPKEEVRVGEFESDLGDDISNANEVVKEYFNPQSRFSIDHNDINQVVLAYQEVITTFIKHTTSGRKDPNLYTPENILALLKDSYKNTPLTLADIEAYLEIKGYLLGGDSKAISKKELKVLHGLLPLFGSIAIELEPYRQLILGEGGVARDQSGYSEFQKGFTLFSQKIRQLLSAFDQYKEDSRSISVSRLTDILMGQLFKADPEKSKQFGPLISAFKNFSLNDSGEELSRKDFDVFVEQGTIAFEAYKHYLNFIRQEGENKVFTNPGHIVCFMVNIKSMLVDSSVFKTVTLSSVAEVINLAEVVISRSFNRNPDRKMSFDKFEKLIFSLEDAGIMKGPLTADTLSIFMEKMSERWLAPGQGRKTTDLNYAKLNYTKKLISEWFQRQKVVNDLFANNPSNSLSLLPIESGLTDNPTVNHWLRIFKNTGLHQWNSRGQVFFTRDIRNFSYEELTVANSLETLIELFTKPYNLDRSNINDFTLHVKNIAGKKVNESQEIYEVLRILGVELAFMDSRVHNTGERSFVEGNNFSTQRRADDVFDFYEIYDFLSILLSAGSVADQIYAALPADSHLDYKDVHHKFVTKKAAFMQFMLKNFSSYFSHLTTVNKYWSQSNNLEKEKFLGTLEYASRGGVITNKPVDMGEIRVFVSILYYLESIFYMFDENRDGIAAGAEIRTAEVHFNGFISGLILEKRASMIQDYKGTLKHFCGEAKTDRELAQCLAPKLFVHLLNGGGVPGGIFSMDSLGFLRKLNKETEDTAFENTRANPQQVLWVFSTLAKVNHSGHLEEIKAFLRDEKNRSQLSEQLSLTQAPECRRVESSIFCTWARMLNCNETVNDQLFTYFQENRDTFLTNLNWSEEPDESFNQVMTVMTSNFKGKTFSTLCGFPPYYQESTTEWIYNVGDEVLNGNPEKKGKLDQAKEWWDSFWEE